MKESQVTISKRLVAINSASFALVQVFSGAILCWVQHHLLYGVSPEEYSVYVVIGGFFFLMPVFSQVFVGSTLRYVVSHYARGELDQVTSVVSSMFPVLLPVGCLIFAAAILGVQNIETLFVIPPGCKGDAQLMLLMIALWAVLNLVLSPFTLGIHVLQRYVLNNAIVLLGEILKMALLFVLLFGVSTRALWVAVASTVGELFCLLVRTVISLRLVPELRFSVRHVRLQTLPELISFGFWDSFLVLSQYLRNHTTILVMNRFGTPIDVTCFSLGRSMNRQACQLWEPVRLSLGPPLIAMYATGSSDRLRRAYCTGGRYAIWLVMAAITPLIVFRHEFVRLYAGDRYEQAANVLFFWLLPIPFQLVNVMLPQVARAQAQLRGLGLRTLWVQVVSLAAMFIVVWQFRMGCLNAAIAFAFFSIVGELIFIWPHGCKLIGAGIREVVREIITPGLIPVAIGTVALMFIRNVYHPNTWWGIVAGSAIGGIAYDRRGLVGLWKRSVVEA
jgi:O-antigen/teichoic acid export membrane protein